MIDKKIESLVKFRDALSSGVKALNDYINSLGPAEVHNEEKQQITVNEVTFTILKFEAQQGAKIGSYEVARKADNLPEKWQSAYNLLSKSNATIQNRYKGQAYSFSYWLYGSDKIYRQKLKTQGAPTQ